MTNRCLLLIAIVFQILFAFSAGLWVHSLSHSAGSPGNTDAALDCSACCAEEHQGVARLEQMLLEAQEQVHALAAELEDARRNVQRTGAPVGGSSDAALTYMHSKWVWAAAEVKRLVARRKIENALPELGDDKPPPGARALAFSTPQESVRRCGNATLFRVATWNIWNINSHWDKRQADMVATLAILGLDVLALQELRIDPFTNISQLDALHGGLRAHLPHALYHKMHAEKAAQGYEEGLGFLSRYPIEDSEAFWLLPVTKDGTMPGQPAPGAAPPKGSRLCLRARLRVPGVDGPVHVFNVHFGIDDLAQCVHVGALLEYLDRFKSEHIFVLGDFNQFFDFEWPIDFLTARRPWENAFFTHARNPCAGTFSRLMEARAQFERLRDSFAEVYPPEDIRLKNLVANPNRGVGHTFTNYDDGRTEDSSRPDRILSRSASLVECDVALFGYDPINDPESPRKVYASDHRGVMASYVWDASHLPRAAKLAKAVAWKAREAKEKIAKKNQPRAVVAKVRLAQPSTVSATLPPYDGHLPEFAFDGSEDTFFWSQRPPTTTDVLKVQLTAAVRCSSVHVTSGVPGKASDRIEDGYLEVRTDSGSETVDFVNGTATVTFDGVASVTAMVVHLARHAPEDSASWVAVAEISLRLPP